MLSYKTDSMCGLLYLSTGSAWSQRRSPMVWHSSAPALLHLPLTMQVVSEIMERFDKDKSGSVNYKEFVSALFPVLGSGLR